MAQFDEKHLRIQLSLKVSHAPFHLCHFPLLCTTGADTEQAQRHPGR